MPHNTNSGATPQRHSVTNPSFSTRAGHTLAGYGNLAAGMLTSEVLTGGAEVIDGIAPEWRALCKSRYDEPFYRPEWVAGYVRAFAPDKNLFVVTARLNGRLIGVLPLIRETVAWAGFPARRLRAAANAHSCRYDLVHDASCAAEVVNVIWHALTRIRSWDVLELTDVPRGSAAAMLARVAQADGCATHAAPRARSPYIALTQPSRTGGPNEWIDPKFRANLHRRMRKLQLRGDVQLVCTDIVDERLEQFYTLEASGWKGRERSAIACNAATRRFYDIVAKEAAAAGRLRLYSLLCEGRPVAMHYGLSERGRYFLLKTAYDEALQECSPGQLITYEVLRELASRKYGEFDFLGPLMEWKRAWKPRLRPHADWYVFRGPAGYLLHSVRFRLRPTIGRALRRWRNHAAGLR